MPANNFPVIKLTGITSPNANLLPLNGVDLSKPMGIVKIDFGDIAAPDSTWNVADTVSDNYGGGVTSEVPEFQALDTLGNLTRLFVTTDELFFGNSDPTGDAAAEGQDYIFLAVPGSLAAYPSTGALTASIYLDNLDPGKTYDLEMLARRDATGNRTAEYHINDGLTKIVNAASNTTTTTWASVSPDENGRIKLTIDKTNYQTAPGFGYINWLTVSEN
jgi:hypothetical protein